ncbi:hypothetical protein KFU94_16185 [Chloroflexi bacterium TSY]|nr:hypothetical protein [Chloroflexi bacterium TSY]
MDLLRLEPDEMAVNRQIFNEAVLSFAWTPWKIATTLGKMYGKLDKNASLWGGSF